VPLTISDGPAATPIPNTTPTIPAVANRMSFSPVCLMDRRMLYSAPSGVCPTD
jgi:hypothetical protein